MMGQLYRERILLTNTRSILSTRGTLSTVMRKGIDNTSEAFLVLSQNDRLLGESVVCCLEQGWLHLLQYEDGDAGINFMLSSFYFLVLLLIIFFYKSRYDDTENGI